MDLERDVELNKLLVTGSVAAASVSAFVNFLCQYDKTSSVAVWRVKFALDIKMLSLCSLYVVPHICSAAVMCHDLYVDFGAI